MAMPFLKRTYVCLLTGCGLCMALVFSAQAQSVETRSKEAVGQEPAFENQTRAQQVKTESDFSVRIIAENLNEPWGLDFLPDGRIIVSEKSGNIRIVNQDGTVGEPLRGVPNVHTRGSAGLLDLKLAPDFEQSRRVFWTYVVTSNGAPINRVASARLSEDESELEEVTVIYESEATQGGRNHFGSRLLFDQDGLLYVTFGDHFFAGRSDVQNLNSALGKIIRINQDGSPAEGNPFADRENALPEIWSIGHRNPQGLAFNPVTGDLWESEHGPRAGDEINIIQPGANYGWPVISYGLEYNGRAVGDLQQDGMEQPVYYWDPAVALSGMTFYTGDAIPEWENNLFVGALRGQHIIRLVIDNANGQVVGEERLLESEGQRFRYLVQGPDGALYATTDHRNGRIYKIGK